MKKMLLGVALLLSATVFAFNKDVDDRIAKRFNEAFPTAKDIKWYTYETFYEVAFNYNQVACRIQYDLEGGILSVKRYYGEKDLPVFIMAKLKQRYPGKKVFGISEITAGQDVLYEIVLEDAKTWTKVVSDAYGRINTSSKYRKA